MARERVQLSKSFTLPRTSEATFRVVGNKVYIFLHDNRICYNFGTVCVLDTGAFFLHSRLRSYVYVWLMSKSYLLMPPTGFIFLKQLVPLNEMSGTVG